MKLVLVMACDEAYAMPLATALRSVVEAYQGEWPLMVYLLSHGVSENNQNRVLASLPKGSISVQWIDVNITLFETFAISRHVSRMTYARLLIPYVLPSSISRVLYLDADVLVFGDLTLLWETDLQGLAVGAVVDELDQRIKADAEGLEDVPRVKKYFNAGVLVINLVGWREQQISERALKYLSEHPRPHFWDQDALNVVCDGFWRQIDSRWNHQDHYCTNVRGMPLDKRPAIIHFVTSLKPWDARTLSVNADLYNVFRDRTCFARTPFHIVFEMLTSVWCRCKRYLRQYKLMRLTWRIMMRLEPRRAWNKPMGS